MELKPVAKRFVLHWGEMGSTWGVNRTVAQIHALLFIAGRPLNADDITETLEVARSNVSMSLKELSNWNLIRTVPLLGDRREHYETRLRPGPGVFDTLLLNERGELTEFTRGNVALRIAGRWLTPALHCGLLAGTCRADLLARGEITEAVLVLADLQRADEVAFFNSVRGWLRAQAGA